MNGLGSVSAVGQRIGIYVQEDAEGVPATGRSSGVNPGRWYCGWGCGCTWLKVMFICRGKSDFEANYCKVN